MNDFERSPISFSDLRAAAMDLASQRRVTEAAAQLAEDHIRNMVRMESLWANDLFFNPDHLTSYYTISAREDSASSNNRLRNFDKKFESIQRERRRQTIYDTAWLNSEILRTPFSPSPLTPSNLCPEVDTPTSPSTMAGLGITADPFRFSTLFR